MCEHEQHLCHVPRIAVGHTAYLAQLLHEVALRVQPAGRVGQDQVVAAGGGPLHGVEHNGGGIAALAAAHDVGPRTVGPRAELLGGRGPEGVGRGHDDRAPAVELLAGDLADGRGLAHAVDTHEEPHVGPAGLEAHRAVALGQKALQLGLEAVEQDLGISDALVGGRGAQVGEHPLGGRHTHVGTDQGLLELIPRLVVDLARPDGAQVAAERTPRLGEAVAEAGPDGGGGRRRPDGGAAPAGLVVHLGERVLDLGRQVVRWTRRAPRRARPPPRPPARRRPAPRAGGRSWHAVGRAAARARRPAAIGWTGRPSGRCPPGSARRPRRARSQVSLCGGAYWPPHRHPIRERVAKDRRLRPEKRPTRRRRPSR